jgi:pantoate--beta-alanine ligase
METVDTIDRLRGGVGAAKLAGNTIAVVPTMGAFHEGHLTLMRRARQECGLVVVTLFVNPTQFNNPEDFRKYPRDMARDASMAQDAGVDLLFTPKPEEIYPAGFNTTVTVSGISDRLEGASRPGHFAGVATVVAKLLNIVGADRAYFGEKDWQQLQVIKRLSLDLNIPTAIVPVPTVRESDGLAMSSRNVRLSPDERKAAVVISRALADAKRLADAGTTDAAVIAMAMQAVLSAEPLARVDYAVVVNPATLEEVDTIDHGALAAIAAYFGSVRLIDNCLLS